MNNNHPSLADFITLPRVLATGAFIIIAFFAERSYSRIDEISRDLQDLRIQVTKIEGKLLTPERVKSVVVETIYEQGIKQSAKN